MSLVPYVIEQTARGERSYDIFSRLLNDRIIVLSEDVNATSASLVVAQLLYLEGQDPEKDIYFYINSPGGSISDGMAIHDTMNYIKCDVSTICIGMAASMGSFLLASGAKGKRYALPNSEILIHQPLISGNGISGQATDIQIHANHIVRIRERMNQLYSQYTGQPLETIQRDTERDNYMTAQQAKEYGLIDDNLTVEQSLTFTAKLRIAHDASKAEIAAAVAHAIDAVDLNGREKTLISQLSGGQKKRVSIAMELLASPRLLILDEPTSGLSPDLDRSMMELCRRLSHQNCTVLMVTHNMSNINLCDRIAFLGVGGVLCYYGPPETLHDYFAVELTSDIFEKLRDPEQVELYRRKYFTTPEFNRLAAAWPEAAQEADKRCAPSK